jgi:Clp amino terminal domain, pathogenicity island component/LTXXQ motif family protein
VLSRNLEKSLHRALAHANERRHEYATLEHLLLALTEDQDAVAMLRACGVDLDRLRCDILNYINNELANLVATHGDDAKPTASFQRALQRAAIHVQSSSRDEVTGANVLVAMFAERESHAVYFLQEQDMTRFDAVNYISHGIAKRPPGSGTREARMSHSGDGFGEGTPSRDWDIRNPMSPPFRPRGGTGWGMWGSVQYVKGRLAFMKAELEISDAQERLWEVFAEALRDFLKTRSRSDFGGPAELAALPDRVAMRERELASDLELLRHWKPIVETFYAGLSEEQRRGADQLLTQLFGF